MATIEELKQKAAANKQKSVSEAFGTLSSAATTYTKTGANQKVTQQVDEKAAGNRGILENVGSIIGGTAKLAGKAAATTGKFIFNSAKDVVYDTPRNFGQSLYDLATINKRVSDADFESRQLDAKFDRALLQYRAGALSKKDYDAVVKEVTTGRREIQKQLDDVAGVKPGEFVSNTAELTANILTLGGFSAISKASIAGAKQFSEKVLPKVIGENGTNLSKLVFKNTSISDSLERALTKNGIQKLQGETTQQWVTRNTTQVGTWLLVNRPLFIEQNITGANEIYADMAEGKYGDGLKTAGWYGTQLVGGGPIGYFVNASKKGGKALQQLAYGKDSFIDEISKKIGDKSSLQMATFIQSKQSLLEGLSDNVQKILSKALGKDLADDPQYVARILQETNLRMADDNVKMAVDNVLEHYSRNRISLEELTPKQLIQDMVKWHAADKIANTLEPGHFVVIRLDTATKNAIAKQIEQADNTQDAWSAVLKMSRDESPWGSNRIFMKNLEGAFNEGGTTQEIANRVRKITTASSMAKEMPKNLAKQLNDLGYTAMYKKEAGWRKTPLVTELKDTRQIVTAAIKGEGDDFAQTVTPSPGMATITGALDKIGLGIQAQNKLAYQKLSQSVVASLNNVDTALLRKLGAEGSANAEPGGRAILQKLQNYVDNMKALPYIGRISSYNAAVTDIRQLSARNVSDALGVSDSEASTLLKAIKKGYMDTPLELRGAGDALVDRLHAFVPGYSTYSRVQSALRYTYNPFFRAQEMTEAAILSRMSANKFIWMGQKGYLDRATLDATTEELKRSGILSGKSSVSGEAAQDLVIGKISANLTKSQYRNLSGLATIVAERQGKTVAELLRENPQQIEDALRIIVQYPTKGPISSPLARTLNIAFFPMRYNLKLTAMVAAKLGTLPPSVQLGFINSFMKAKDWLSSDEGVRWQSENTDALQALKWLTPYGSIESALRILTGNVNSVAELGQLGGLPLGVITQMLDSQGIIDINTPYVNPRTGEVVPTYIPANTKARAAQAITDYLGSLFTYPGRTLGLPGKNEKLRDLSTLFTGQYGKDWDKEIELDRLAETQRNMVRVLAGDTSDEALDGLYNSPAPGQFQWYTLPGLDLPEPPPRPTKATAKKGKTRAKLPGQL